VAAAGARPPLDARLTLRLASLTWRDGPIRRLHLEAGVVNGRRELRRLEAVLPGQTAMSWSGVPAAADAELAGDLSVQAGELRALLAWLGVASAELPATGLASLEFTAKAMLGEAGLALHGLQARLDTSRIEGSLRYSGATRPRLDAVLAVDRLNTAVYGAPPPAWGDWRRQLTALDGSLDLTVTRLSHDVLRGQGFRLRGALAGGRLDLSELRVTDLAGSDLELRGTLDLPIGAWDLEGELGSADPRFLLRLADVAPPPDLDRLAPLRLAGSARREAGVATLDLRLTAKGATAALGGQIQGELADGALDLAASVQAPDTGALLLALGWPAPAQRPSLGPLDITANLRRGSGPVAIAAAASAGSSRLSLQLALDATADRPLLGGVARAAMLDTALLAALYETLALPLDFPPGRPWLWPGVWPTKAGAWRWLDRLDLHLPVAVAALHDRGEDLGPMAGTILLSNGALSVTQLSLPVAGGNLGGAVRIIGKGDHAVFNAGLRLSGAEAEQIAKVAAPGSTVRGKIDLDFAVQGQGRSIADLVASLSGGGELDLRQARLTGVEVGPATPGGPAAALAQIDEASLGGDLTVRDGMAVSAPPGLALAFPGGSASLDLRFDLLAWLLEARLTASGVTRRYLGPPGRIRPVPAP
jgi:hypothetical protein